MQRSFMKKLLLIHPAGRRSGYLLSKYTRFPPLGLAYVAAVTPDSWEIRILDETFESCSFESADLVGITSFTSNINRAYEIADGYRTRGTPVVMGGIHVSMLPEEALEHCDAVVAGEVEEIWSRVLEDFEKQALSGIYRGPQIDLSQSGVVPRRDLLHPAYEWHPVQTSRGCPFNCSFCSVSRYLGREYRQRTADSVLEELESIRGKRILFLDDNLTGYSRENRKRALHIFNGMIQRGMKKKWWMQASINVTEDEELLEKAAEAGCTHVFIGFETRDLQTLRTMKKGINVKTGIENYHEVIRRLHRHGIAVLGAFIIGNDYEQLGYYRELSDFILDAGVDIVQITVLTPLPGTDLMEQMEREDRLVFKNFPEDWEKYRLSYMTFQPEGTDHAIIYQGNNAIKNRIYTFPGYQKRLWNSFRQLGKLSSFLAVLKYNAAMKQGWKNAHYHNHYPCSFTQERK
jgi:radical SAM superfamily enzyme YgiQ (UPF0313 family)